MSEKYDGDYKVEVSDKGTVNFTLNWKWLVGICISMITIFGYLVVDKYFITPMSEKDAKIIKLETADKEKDIILRNLESNQKILLDRTYTITQWITRTQNNNIDYESFNNQIPHNQPGENNELGGNDE